MTDSGGQKRTGQVKWFNNKQGYGFVQVHSLGSEPPVDTFVHHSSLQTQNELFRYLVQGEYVEFDLGACEDGRTVARNVTGINGGTLMCEVRNERASTYSSTSAVSEAVMSS